MTAMQAASTGHGDLDQSGAGRSVTVGRPRDRPADRSDNVHRSGDTHQRGDIVAPDGMPLVWLGRRAGRTVERVCRPDLMPALMDRGREIGARHYLYGGASGVPERIAARMRAKYPSVNIVGLESPPFRPLTDEDDRAAVDRINAARPDYVWVGLGTPKQDLWLAEHRRRLDASVLLAVGAAFDYLGGSRRRAPRALQRTGLEWLWRLASEPRRLRSEEHTS